MHALKNWWQKFEKYPQRNWWISVILLGVTCFVAFLWHLGSVGLVDETEPLFAEAARQMNVTGDWITPYFNGATRFDKPPLVYWLMAIAYQLVGDNAWGARLPSALSAIAMTIFGFFTLLKFGFPSPKSVTKEPNSPRTQRQLWLSAWLGSAMMALNLQTMVWARTGVSDMLLSACMNGAIFCFFWGYCSMNSEQLSVNNEDTQKQITNNKQQIINPWYIAFYVLLALAVLTKGPVGIVLPGLTILAFLFYVGKFWEVAKEAKLVFGAVLFSFITIPWFIAVILANGQDYIDTFFGYHNIERFTQVVNQHSAPWYFYFLVVLVGFMPWSLYLPIAMAKLRFWRRSFWQQQPRSAHLGLFALFWFATIFIFFSVAVTKLPSYTLPLLPGASILVALFWSQELTREGNIHRPQNYQRKNWSFLITGIINVIFLLLLVVGCLYGPYTIGYDPAALDLAEQALQSTLPEIGAVILFLGAIAIAFLLYRQKNWRWIFCVNFITLFCFITFALLPAASFADNLRQKPLRELAQLAGKIEQPREEFVMIGFQKPSIVFYSQRPVTFFSHTPHFLQRLKENASDRPQDYLILSRPDKIRESNLKVGDYEYLAGQGSYQLVRVNRDTILQRNLEQ
jgi:4-amino-4-deoxy-L-arabinose transferase-like glycosyltransferase